MANTPHHEIEILTSKSIPENNADLTFNYLIVIMTTIFLSLTIVAFGIAAYIYIEPEESETTQKFGIAVNLYLLP